MINMLAAAMIGVVPVCSPSPSSPGSGLAAAPVAAMTTYRTGGSGRIPGQETPRELYAAGLAFDTFLQKAEARKQMWHDNWGAAAVPDALLERARAVAGPFYILAVAIDACSDSVNSIPVIARLVALVPGLEMRIVDSTRGRSVMAAHRTKDGRAATPTLLLLDRDFAEVGCWVERPAKLREWYDAKQKEGVPVRKLTEQKMGWYREDAGREILSEVVQMLEAAARGGRVCSSAG